MARVIEGNHGNDSKRRVAISSQKVTSGDIIFPIMQRSDCNSPLSDIRCPFNNTSMILIQLSFREKLNFVTDIDFHFGISIFIYLFVAFQKLKIKSITSRYAFKNFFKVRSA